MGHINLVEHWAPNIYQQVNDESDEPEIGKGADFITSVNFDGDWVANNNWEHTLLYPDSLTGMIYYWWVESETHFYIGYAIFHPRDWSDKILFLDPSSEHENDMEYVLMVIEKDGTKYGKFYIMFALAHRDLTEGAHTSSPTPYDFIINVETEDVRDSSPMDEGTRNKDALFTPTWDSHSVYEAKPVIYIMDSGHGIYPTPKPNSLLSFERFNFDRPYVKYISTSTNEPGQIPTDDNGDSVYSANYELRNIEELYNQRENDNLFTTEGLFVGDDINHITGGDSTCGDNQRECSQNAANPPWESIQDQDYRGQLFYHPAEFLHSHRDILMSQMELPDIAPFDEYIDRSVFNNLIVTCPSLAPVTDEIQSSTIYTKFTLSSRCLT
ncbi:MAG: hypothetical protein ACW99A_23430, partial [Candidatus Kariarchaeaceae archaeon]|jgi:hypothetical protein